MKLFYVCPKYVPSSTPNYGMMIVSAENKEDAIKVARGGKIRGKSIKNCMSDKSWFSDENPIEVVEIDTTKDAIIGASDD